MKKDYQERNKFFYASPAIFKDWPYKSRLALGMSLKDFWAKKDEIYRFKVNGVMYEIGKEKAKFLGEKYKMRYGALPNIIPLSAFTKVEDKKVVVEEMKQLTLI